MATSFLGVYHGRTQDATQELLGSQGINRCGGPPARADETAEARTRTRPRAITHSLLEVITSHLAEDQLHPAVVLRRERSLARHYFRLDPQGPKPSKVSVGETMLGAYVLIQTRVGMGPAVTRDVGRIEGVISSQEVTGPYDVIVSAEAPTLDQVGRLVATHIHAVEGVTRTITCFRARSE